VMSFGADPVQAQFRPHVACRKLLLPDPLKWIVNTPQSKIKSA